MPVASMVVVVPVAVVDAGDRIQLRFASSKIQEWISAFSGVPVMAVLR
jgi:hypothetical protein